MKTNKQTRKQQRGFSIIELMIGVAIIGLLASVAWPELSRMIIKTRAAERDMMMHGIATMLKAECSRTESTGEAFNISGAQNPAAAPTLLKAVLDPTLAGWDKLGFENSSDVYYRYSFWTANLPGRNIFIVMAQGDVDGDGLIATRTSTFELIGSTWNQEDVDSLVDDY